MVYSEWYYLCMFQDYNCDDARSRRGSETQIHRSEYDQDSVSKISKTCMLSFSRYNLIVKNKHMINDNFID